MKPYRYQSALALALSLTLSLSACAQRPIYAYKETSMPEVAKLSPRLQALFSKTKLVCFGRYALEVPQEAKLNWGPVAFPAPINVIEGDAVTVQRYVAKDIERIKNNSVDSKSFELIYNQAGPVDGSWQIQYYESKYQKKRKSVIFKT